MKDITQQETSQFIYFWYCGLYLGQLNVLFIPKQPILRFYAPCFSPLLPAVSPPWIELNDRIDSPELWFEPRALLNMKEET
jgi:hypothetical protein